LKAFREVAVRYPHFRLRLTGSGPEEKSLRILAERPETLGRVVFSGAVSHKEVQEMMRACAIVAVPSRSEGLGMTVLEAMAAGKPVVAAAVGGIPEILEHGVTGLLVPPEDHMALAAAVIELAADPALRSRLGKAGLEAARTSHTWGAAAGAYIKCYEEAIAARRGGTGVTDDEQQRTLATAHQAA